MNPQFSQPKGAVSKETNKDSIARKFGCKKSEVLYAKTGAGLTGYKVIYDKVSQRSYALPSNLPAGATVTSLIDGVLVHSAGTADLGELAVLREEFVVLTEDFTSGFTIRVKNEVVSDGVNLYRWAGSLTKVVNASSTVAGTGGVSSSAWVRVDLNALRSDLNNPSLGASLVKVKFSSNTVARTLSDKVYDNAFYVEDYGALGDGTTSDIAAVEAMISEKGYARFQRNKTYNLTGWSFVGTSLILLGAGRPDYIGSTLVGGTILKGMANHSVTHAWLQDLGHISVTDGIVVNSGISPAPGGNLRVKNVIGVGTGESGSSHAQLYQGFTNVDIDEAEGNDSRYGVVIKSRRGFINKITCRNVSTAGLFIKGDTGAPSGGVTNGSASNIVIKGVNVINSSANTGCSGLYIQSSTDLVSKVIAFGIRSIYGKTGVELAGGGTGPLQTNSVLVSDVLSENTANSGVLVSGNATDFRITNVMTLNPANGSAFTIQGQAINGYIGDVHLTISDPAITSALAGFIDGTAMKLGNVTVRNPYRNMSINMGRARVNPGSLTGNVSYQNDGNMAVLNGAAWGSTVPNVETRADNFVVFHGSILTTGVTIANSPNIATLPFSFPVSMIHEVAIKLRDGSYAATRLYLSGTTMQILTGSATTIAEVYLEGLTIGLPRV